jgi:hypothetical protein
MEFVHDSVPWRVLVSPVGLYWQIAYTVQINKCSYLYIDRNFVLDHEYINRKGMLKVTDAFPLDPKQRHNATFVI